MDNLPVNDRITGPLIAAGGETDLPADFPLLREDGYDTRTGITVRRERGDETVTLTWGGEDFDIIDEAANSFTVRLAAAAEAGDRYFIISRLPQRRPRAHAAGGATRTPILEGDARQATAQAQELRRDVDRAVSAPPGEPGMELPRMLERAGRMALFGAALSGAALMASAYTEAEFTAGVEAAIDSASAAHASATAAAASLSTVQVVAAEATQTYEAARDLAVEAISANFAFANLSSLLASDILFPADTTLTCREEAFCYKVAPAVAVDEHLTTAGGVKLYVLPVAGRHYSRAWNIGTTGDQSAQLQKMIDHCGATSRPGVVQTNMTLASGVKFRHHVQRFEFLGDITYTGAAGTTCIGFDRVGTAYPVNQRISGLSIILTADGQDAIQETCSYSNVEARVTMSAAGCTNCVGLRSIGDVEHGTGPYYNTFTIRFQGFNRTGSFAHVTTTSTGDLTASRGPNANTYIFPRMGQFLVHVLDQVGSGNRWEIGAVENASGTGVAFRVGHASRAASLAQNTYVIRYLENTVTAWESTSGKFGAQHQLYIHMLTGGGAVSDLATNLNGTAGILQVQDGVRGFRRRVNSTNPFTISCAATLHPLIDSDSNPGLDLRNRATDVTVRMDCPVSVSSGTHAIRFAVGGTAFVRGGSTGWFSDTDNTRDLGSASVRWRAAYAREFRPGAGGVIWTSGSGSPEGVVTGPPGSIYAQTDGTGDTTLWKKNSGTGNTGWAQIAQVRRATAQANSTASDVAGLVSDFNALLGRLRTAGLMET
ncbi:MAG: hypothetical protein ACK4E3_10460 [Brevundimonas sp.]|uniref:hypothetical protein n=1 Tax=Brevundimonas sp. TaxID=1871086 RepID=UPI003918A5F0